MPHRAKATIGQKITRIVMLTSSIVLLMSLAASVYLQATTFAQSTTDKMTTLAQVISANIRQNLISRQSWQVNQILETLVQEPSIEVATVLDHAHTPFAHYLNRNQTSFAEEMKKKAFDPQRVREAAQTGLAIQDHSAKFLTVYVPIHAEGRYLGCIYLQSNQNKLLQNLLWFAVVALTILFFTLLVAFGLGSHLQRQITRPLSQLVRRMQIISDDQVCSLDTPEPQSNIYEINDLLGSFNAMLHQIKKHESALQNYSSNLEQQVKQRTKDLLDTNSALQDTIQQLDLAKQQADDANAAKSRFLANMSHEIRTPMIGVLGMTELLAQQELSSNQRELVHTIHSSGESLLSLLNDLLDISKIEVGKLELECEPFSPGQVIDQACELLAENAYNKGLDFTVVLQPDVPQELAGDAVRLRQIVLNLLSNAVKFTHQGSITVELSVIAASETMCQLQLTVADTGIGLTDTAKKTIFEAFTQADNSTTRQYGGTGLGLTIVRQLAELMKGHVRIKDNHPSGSLFIVEIELTRTSRRSTIQDSWHLPARPQTVFLATGNPQLKRVIAFQLQPTEGDIVILENMEQARQRLGTLTETQQQNTLLCVDSALPGGGLTLLQELARLAETQKIGAILFIAPHNQALTREQMNALKVTATLAKPIKVDSLINSLQHAVQAEAKELRSPAVTASPDGALTILLAEDNPTNQRLVQLILQPLGHRLVSVNNGQEALQACSRENFDLVLMDCQMPVMDGYEATRELRARHVTTPIIALTAHASEQDIELCFQAGMDDYLSKPYKQMQLRQKIERYHRPTRPVPAGDE
ncbi:MAG: response regulator [Desulfuromonadaceae bacterium]|nr:response regulator [Desulfuromonadaceae bacterium]